MGQDKVNKADVAWLIELERAWSKKSEVYVDGILMRDVIREILQLRRQVEAGDKLEIAGRNMFGPTIEKKGDERDNLDEALSEYHKASKEITEEELDLMMKEIMMWEL